MLKTELPTIERYRKIVDDVPRAEKIINKVTETFGKYLTINEEVTTKSEKYLIDVLYLYFIKKVPDYFWEIPASSSGKYHPTFDNVKGGLINHTIMCCEIALELFRLDMFNCDIQDGSFLNILIALIIHDSFKSGYTDTKHTIYAHPSIAADEFFDTFNWYLKNYDEINNNTITGGAKIDLTQTVKEISSLIQTHMGQWFRDVPTTSEQKFVHLCDYIASRKFFDFFK